MPTTYTIYIINKSGYTQNFFVFQDPAVYSGGKKVYLNSLWSEQVAVTSEEDEDGGSVAAFQLMLQYYAGVQEQIAPPKVGVPSGYSSATQPISLTPAKGLPVTKNATEMTVNPLKLSPPIPDESGVEEGSFRINTPLFNPDVKRYNVGTASKANGKVTLSSFIEAQPNQHIDCTPKLKFYVQTGSHIPGTVVDFTSSSRNAAVCDTSGSYVTFNVTYTKMGEWVVEKFYQTTNQLPNFRNTAEPSDVETGHISAGYSANFYGPVTIQIMGEPSRIIANKLAGSSKLKVTRPCEVIITNEAGANPLYAGDALYYNGRVIVFNLNDPNLFNVNTEYQVSVDGKINGRMCIAFDRGSAIFSAPI